MKTRTINVKDREITLYPDLQAYDKWKEKAVELRSAGYMVAVSNILEQYATADDHEDGLDIADLYLRQHARPIETPSNQENDNHTPAEVMPPGWSRNDAGELCDQHGLTIFDWGLDPDPAPIEIEAYARECKRYLITVK